MGGGPFSPSSRKWVVDLSPRDRPTDRNAFAASIGSTSRVALQDKHKYHFLCSSMHFLVLSLRAFQKKQVAP